MTLEELGLEGHAPWAHPMSPDVAPSPKSMEYPALITVPEKCTVSGVAPEVGEAEKDDWVAAYCTVKGAETAVAWIVLVVLLTQ